MDIKVSRTLQYGKYKQHSTRVLRCVDYLESKGHRFFDYLNLPPTVNVWFKPFRSPYGAFVGSYDSINSCAEIDPRILGWPRTLLTVCHELIHAEQFYEGRLDTDEHNFFWRGKIYPLKDITPKSYYKLPWEVEAQKREHKIYEKVFKT